MKTTADEILTILQNRNSTAGMLANNLGVSESTIHRHLRPLYKSSKVSRYTHWFAGGGYTRFYFVPAYFTVCRCKCGTTNQHYYPPNSTSGRASQLRFWLKHNGPGHGPVTKRELRAIKRRKKKARDSE